VFGLGVGSQASYARPGEEWTFYEIDPAMERVAADPRFFTFLADSPTKNIRILLGDARLRLREAPDHSYDLLVMDAFGSDSVPAHLLTREALDLYLTKLAPGGVLIFNISNRYLGLRPVLADLANSTSPPLVCCAQEEVEISEAEVEAGKQSSHWLVMARRPEDLGSLIGDPRWDRLQQLSGAPLWTDDASNILQVLKWR
jgi:SAM-dependent methyltransferase